MTTRPDFLPIRLFGKYYVYDQRNPERVTLHRDPLGDEAVAFALSTPGRSAVQEGALPGNKPASGASSGGRS